MNIILNNVNEQAHEGDTVKQLLDDKKIYSKYIAVEINRKVVPKSNYHKHKIHEGDKIEIITAIGGG